MELGDRLKELEEDREGCKAQVMAAMKQAEKALIEGEDWAISYKNQKRKGYTKVVKPAEYRVFRKVKA